MDILERLEECGIVPVVVIEDENDALELGRVLMESGLACAEITFRTDAALKAMKLMSENYPDLLLGAGTVLNPKQVDEAIEAGAKFIVSPGFNPRVVKYCLEKNILVIPGAITPTEIERALEFDLNVLKFFPAVPSGGLKMIKALCAPYTNVRFMPTGGINEVNVKDYLKEKVIACCGGSWMLSKELIKNKQFDTILKLCQNAKEIVKEARK